MLQKINRNLEKNLALLKSSVNECAFTHFQPKQNIYHELVLLSWFSALANFFDYPRRCQSQ